MLTIPEFRKPVDRHLRRSLILLFALAACLWIMSGLGSPVGWVQIHILASGPRWLAVVTSLAALIATLFLVVWLLVAWANRDPKLRCPHCDKGLVRHHFKVVATRRCPRCASEILIDTMPQHTANLAGKYVEAVAWRHRRKGLVFLFGLPLLWLVAVGAIYGAFWLNKAGWIGESLSIAVVCISTCGLFTWVIWSLIQSLRMLREKVGCPRCQAAIFPELVSKSGGCGWCGQRMIADPPSGTPDGNGS